MTGSDIIGELLLGYAPLLEAVPAEQMKAGRLPDGVKLTAILVGDTTGIDRATLKAGAFRRVTDRVSVTVRAASWREMKAVIDLVFHACAGKRGDFAGALRVSVTSAGRGPALNGPADSFERAQDFRVSYDVTA